MKALTHRVARLEAVRTPGFAIMFIDGPEPTKEQRAAVNYALATGALLAVIMELADGRVLKWHTHRGTPPPWEALA